VFKNAISLLITITNNLLLVALGLKSAFTDTPTPTIPLILLVLVLGLPGVLIVITAHRLIYVLWMFVYLLSLPIWNFILPTYAFWHFDDFSWGDTRQTAGAVAGADKSGSKITMKRWGDFEQERRFRAPAWNGNGRPKSQANTMGGASSAVTTPMLGGHERTGSRGYESAYRD
jgi:chitin synthase